MNTYKLLIDTSIFYLEPHKVTINPALIEYFNISVGGRVIAYQDDQEWEGMLEYQPDWPIEFRYYIDLEKSIQRDVPLDINLGRKEGLHSRLPTGYTFSERKLLQAMTDDNMNPDTIQQYLNFAMEALKNKYQPYTRETRKDILKISIDTNSNYLAPDKPTIFLNDMRYFAIAAGDRIIGYQDDQEWEGIIESQSHLPEWYQFYLDLNTCIETIVTPEVYKAREDGESVGRTLGKKDTKIFVAQAMFQDGLDIEKIKHYTELSLLELENIQKG
ncbi:hypothetical protein QE450_003617 [Paenibacillus sp. SORGH_AS306]|uniref:hypothetical protein n=1 Tax=unclassified Paenibacillus TaxID=185978 RepID=UPI002781A9BA|nr:MULTISPECIES: hypothetical protein [unclassified Paenibacillus]MDQ1236119.1 hypothetical protein [Paenibacillus sp. SORGH_AS_0306]MDR6108474.1 hypothetical protein [Paenibacillus sp. SORGH_AS_0338]